jgi:putative FmdB family regulatory protein
MPLYEFRCSDCGMFDLWRIMAECSDPAYCPDCDQPAQRVFSAPAVLSGALRLKQENREPQLVKREIEPKASRVKNHAGSRPWMIGH